MPLLTSLVLEARDSCEPPTLTGVLETHAAVMERAVRLEYQLLRVNECINAQGIRSAVLKGLATAHLDYRDPSLRQFGDIDILIRSSSMTSVLESLKPMGWDIGYELPAHHAEFTHAITLIHDQSGVELDVHQYISRRVLGLMVPTEDLLERAVPYQIAGQTLHALAPTDRLIHACLHLISSRDEYRRLSTVADVLVLADQQADPDDVLDRARDYGVERLVRYAIAQSYRDAQLTVPPSSTGRETRKRSARGRLPAIAYLGRRRTWLEECIFLTKLRPNSARLRYLRGHFIGLETDDDRSRLARRASRLKYLASRAARRTPG